MLHPRNQRLQDVSTVESEQGRQNPDGFCCADPQRGAFDIDATVYPIAIKYNKIFVDAFWNSRKQSFSAHLVHCRPFHIQHPVTGTLKAGQ